LALPVHPTIILLRKPRNGVSIEKKKLRGRNVALHTLRVLALLLTYYALRPYGLVVSTLRQLRSVPLCTACTKLHTPRYAQHFFTVYVQHKRKLRIMIRFSDSLILPNRALAQIGFFKNEI
jgi:hypothetical protein